MRGTAERYTEKEKEYRRKGARRERVGRGRKKGKIGLRIKVCAVGSSVESKIAPVCAK